MGALLAERGHGGDRGTARDEKGRFVKSEKPQADNIRMRRQYGTSREDTLARLRRDRPDLAARVDAGIKHLRASRRGSSQRQ